jgi:hypothetical protein
MTVHVKLDVSGGHAITKVHSHGFLKTQVWVQPHDHPCGLCGGQSVNGTYFFTQHFSFLMNYHSTNALYSSVIRDWYSGQI